jgi:S-DNA-T family DNA segregation ATPase FtsK/SpoIIIE
MDEAREVRAGGIGEDLADLLLVVDGWDGFKREFEGLDREIEELAATGLAYGLHIAVTANRWAEIRPALLDNLGTRLELRLNDPIDSIVSRQAASSLPEGVEGRALTTAGTHVQIALPRVDGERATDGQAAALAGLLDESAAHWTGPRAEPIRLLPSLLEADELPPPGPDGVAIGIDERRLEPVRVDLLGGDPHFIVMGDAETGKSSLLRVLATGLAATHAPEDLRILVGDVRRSLADLGALPHVTYAQTPAALQAAAAELSAELAARPEGGGGPRHVVLVDDYDLVSSTTASALAPLAEQIALGRDLGLHVVLARRVGGSARVQYETVFARVRELGSPGVLLSGDPAEGPLLGGVKAQPRPPGRGVLVERGRRPATVQLALARAGARGDFASSSQQERGTR